MKFTLLILLSSLPYIFGNTIKANPTTNQKVKNFIIVSYTDTEINWISDEENAVKKGDDRLKQKDVYYHIDDWRRELVVKNKVNEELITQLQGSLREHLSLPNSSEIESIQEQLAKIIKDFKIRDLDFDLERIKINDNNQLILPFVIDVFVKPNGGLNELLLQTNLRVQGHLMSPASINDSKDSKNQNTLMVELVIDSYFQNSIEQLARSAANDEIKEFISPNVIIKEYLIPLFIDYLETNNQFEKLKAELLFARTPQIFIEKAK